MFLRSAALTLINNYYLLSPYMVVKLQLILVNVWHGAIGES